MALEFWKKKTGPMPNWAWGGLGLGAAVAYSSWQRNRAAGDEAAADEATSTSGINMPESVHPTYVFQDADTNNFTWPSAPPGGGRPPTPDPTPDPDPDPVPRPPTPKPPPPAKKPPPARKPPPAPKGKWVTVGKWNARKAPWNSTVWGITNKLLGPKVSWKTVWGASQNASLRSKRKDPTKIQPGDRIWVPGAK